MKRDAKFAVGSFILGCLSVFIYNVTALKGKGIYFFKILALFFVLIMIFFIAKIIVRLFLKTPKNKTGS